MVVIIFMIWIDDQAAGAVFTRLFHGEAYKLTIESWGLRVA
jgi:hypothetical protein